MLVISIHTGKFFDVVHLLRHCSACTQKESERENDTISRMELLRWYIIHEHNCYRNHDGSAQATFAHISVLSSLVSVVFFRSYQLAVKISFLAIN